MERPAEQKKVEQIVEKIPDKLLNPIVDAQKIKGQLTQQFLSMSYQLANLQNQHQEIFGKLNTTGKSISNKIKRAFDKMKLGKRKDIRWNYDGKGKFVGTPRPEPKKQEKKV